MKKVKEEVKKEPTTAERIVQLKQNQEEAKEIFNQCAGAIAVLEEILTKENKK